MNCPLTPGTRVRLQYHYLVVLALLLLFYGRLAYSAESASVNPPFAVTGTWQVDSDSGIGWVRTASDLRFMAGEAINKQKTYRATLDAPLPEGDWTIDFYVRFNSGSTSLRLEGESPYPAQGPRSIMSVEGRGGAGIPIHWVRVACSHANKQIAVMLDGKQSIKEIDGSAPLPVGRVSLAMNKYNWNTGENPEVARVLSFAVTKGADTPMCVNGPAFSGWTIPLKKKAFVDIKDLDVRMNRLFQSAATDTGKSNALAAKILMEYDTSGAVSAKTWQQLSTLVTELLPRDRGGLAIALPMAAACGSTVQKEQAKAWIAAFFDVKFTEQWRKLNATGNCAEKALLLDPVQVTRMDPRLSHRILPYWTSALKTSAPQYALLPLTYFLENQGWKPEVSAWLLPDLLEASPAYGKEMISTVMDFLNSTSPYQPGEPDRTMSFAAGRLAKSDMAAAQTFLNAIKDPAVKSDTILYMTAASGGRPLSPQDARLVEALLKQSIAEAKPTRAGDTPVARMMKLVEFYDSQNQPEKAANTLAQAVTKIGGEDESMGRDTIAIARYKRAKKTADYQEWWNKAVACAEAEDAAKTEPDSPADVIYISPLTPLALDLVNEGKLDEALVIARKLDIEMRKSNRAMVLDRIIVKMLNTNLEGAIKLLSEYPDMRAKYGITGVLAAKVAETDFNRALNMLKDMPEQSKTNALFRLCQKAPAGKLGLIIPEFQPAFAAENMKSNARSFNSASAGNKWSQLPPDAILSMWEAVQGPSDFAAVSLLYSVGRSCGLEDDPMWVQFSGSNKGDGSIPWGVRRLRSLMKDE